MSDFRQVAQYLTESGDGLGVVDANQNFGAPTEWFIAPPAFGQLPQMPQC